MDKKRIALSGRMIGAIIGVVFSLTILGQGIGGESAHQTPKAPERRLAELRDSLNILRVDDVDPPRRPYLTVRNTTNHDLIVEVSGPAQYRLPVGPNLDRTWEVIPGSYRFDAQIPGFPPLAGLVSLATNTDYCWTFSYKDQ